MLHSGSTLKTLKSVLFAFVVVTITSCGGGSSNTTPSNDDTSINTEVEGLWVLTGVNNQAVLPDRVYSHLANATTNGVQITFYSQRPNSNCFDSLSERISKVGANRYQDRAGDFLTLTAQGNELTMLLEASTLPNQLQRYQSVISLSVQDLQVCSARDTSGKRTPGITGNMLNATQNQ